jgi:hypothetical protein
MGSAHEVSMLLSALRDTLASEAGVEAETVGCIVPTEHARFPLDVLTLNISNAFAAQHPTTLSQDWNVIARELVQLVDEDGGLKVRLLPVFTILCHDVKFNEIVRSNLDRVGITYVKVGNGTGIHCDTLVDFPSRVNFWKGHTPQRVQLILSALIGSDKELGPCHSVPYDCQPFSLPISVEESFMGQTPSGSHYCVSYLHTDALLHSETHVRPASSIPNLYAAGHQPRSPMDCITGITVVHRCVRDGDSIWMLPIKDHMMTITHMLNVMHTEKCAYVTGVNSAPPKKRLARCQSIDPSPSP